MGTLLPSVGARRRCTGQECVCRFVAGRGQPEELVEIRFSSSLPSMPSSGSLLDQVFIRDLNKEHCCHQEVNSSELQPTRLLRRRFQLKAPL